MVENISKDTGARSFAGDDTQPNSTKTHEFKTLVNDIKPQHQKNTSIQNNNLPVFTDDEVANKLINNSSLFTKFTKSTMIYELDDSLSDVQKTQARNAFKEWGELIDLKFKEAEYLERGDVFIDAQDFGSRAKYRVGTAWFDEQGSIIRYNEAAKKIYLKTGAAGAAIGGAFGSAFFSDVGIGVGATIGGAVGVVGGAVFAVGHEAITSKPDQLRIRISNELTPENFGNNFVKSTFMHEINHILDMGHPRDYGKKFPTEIGFSQDTKKSTIMSYNDVDSSGERPSTPMVIDILAAQKIYGANKNTRTGDNIYKFTPELLKEHKVKISDIFPNIDKEIANEKITIPARYIEKNALGSLMTIYDAGGKNDTIDASEFHSSKNTAILDIPQMKSGGSYMVKRDKADQIISLEPGTYSRIGYTESRYMGVAYNTIIENAISADGDDLMIGNFANNYFETQEGKDIIDASSGGADIIYDGADNDHYVLDVSDNSTIDDRLIFTYNEQNENIYFGDDAVYFFNPKNDEIVIAGATEDHKVYLKQDSTDTLVDYGSGTIRLKDVDANEAKNAFRTTIPIISNQ